MTWGYSSALLKVVILQSRGDAIRGPQAELIQRRARVDPPAQPSADRRMTKLSVAA